MRACDKQVSWTCTWTVLLFEQNVYYGFLSLIASLHIDSCIYQVTVCIMMSAKPTIWLIDSMDGWIDCNSYVFTVCITWKHCDVTNQQCHHFVNQHDCSKDWPWWQQCGFYMVWTEKQPHWDNTNTNINQSNKSQSKLDVDDMQWDVYKRSMMWWWSQFW